MTFKLFTKSFLFLTIVSLFACTKDRVPEPTQPDQRVIWTGTNITFEKLDGTDPNEASNQDRISDLVWITRANDGEEIYNAKEENDPTKGSSPKGTLWAVGKVADIDNLNFKTFRNAVDKPKDVVGKDLVLFLIDDEIYISVRFTKWTSGKGGGFAYVRSGE